MKSHLHLTFGIAAAAVLLLITASPQVSSAADVFGSPGFIDYQGRVLDAAGAPLAASTPTNYEVQFRIYDAPSAGSVVWAEKQLITVYNGQFSVRLGEGQPIIGAGGASEGSVGHSSPGLAGAFNGRDRHLGVTVIIPSQTPAEISPRLAFLTSPFSFVASTAGRLTQAPGTSSNVTVGAVSYVPAVVSSTSALSGDNTVVLATASSSSITTTLPQNAAQKQIVITKTDTSVNPVVVAPPAGGTINGSTSNIQLTRTGDSIVLQNAGGNAWWIVSDSRVREVDTSSFVQYSPNGNLGIGVNNPAEKFDVAVSSGPVTSGTTSIIPSLAMKLTNLTANAATPASNAVGMGFGRSNALRSAIVAGTWANDYLDFHVEDLVNPRMRITNQGRLGIGTTAPEVSLHVAGGVRARGGAPGTSGANNNGYAFSGNNGDNDTGMFSLGDGRLNFFRDGNEIITVSSNNNVGIGQTGPNNARLVVGANNTVNAGYGYFAIVTGDYYSNADGPANVMHNSLWCEGNAIAPAWVVASDSRIKKALGRSNAAADLETLQKIKVTDYEFIDQVAHGKTAQKKVIAQELEEILPNAVTRHLNTVPDIYKMAEVKQGWLQLATNLKVGERVKLVGAKAETVVEVTEVDAAEGRFRTASLPEGAKIFVYGREVKDYRTVDYDAITMLNVSATQQLKKEKDAEVAALEKENAQLRMRIAAMETEAQEREARLVAIEKAVFGADAPAVRTVKLEGKTAQTSATATPAQ